MYRKSDMYNLYREIAICGWAKNVDEDHYNEGIELLERCI